MFLDGIIAVLNKIQEDNKMKIYVGNLSFKIEEAGLKELFAPYGDVEEAVIIKDKFSGRSKGFGFVTLADDEAAKKAISELHEKEFEGRKLTVNEAKPIDPNNRPPRRDSGRSFGGGSGRSSGGRSFGNRDSGRGSSGGRSSGGRGRY